MTTTAAAVMAKWLSSRKELFRQLAKSIILRGSVSIIRILPANVFFKVKSKQSPTPRSRVHR